jgi:tRNA(fMet)-specific endonuclease VapC
MLDTNACIRYLNGRAPALKSRVDARQAEELSVCSVVKAEMYYGAARSNDPAKTLANQVRFLSRFDSLPFDDRAAEEYARVRAALSSAGRPIGPNDLLIAAIAIANAVTLVTHNTAEFSRIAGLQIEDWEHPGP